MDERVMTGEHPKGVRLSMVLLGCLGLLNAVLAALAMGGAGLAPGAWLTCSLQALAMLVAFCALAARLRIALPLLVACCALVFLAPLLSAGSPEPDPGLQEHFRQKAFSMAFNWLWIGLLFCAPAWAGRRELRRDWDPARLVPWIATGTRGLFRPGAGTWARVLGGVALFTATLGLTVLLGAGGYLTRGSLKLVAFGLLSGAGLVASGLTLTQDEPASNEA